MRNTALLAAFASAYFRRARKGAYFDFERPRA